MNTTQQETEVKLYIPDLKQLEQRLIVAGAELISERVEFADQLSVQLVPYPGRRGMVDQIAHLVGIRVVVV